MRPATSLGPPTQRVHPPAGSAKRTSRSAEARRAHAARLALEADGVDTAPRFDPSTTTVTTLSHVLAGGDISVIVDTEHTTHTRAGSPNEHTPTPLAHPVPEPSPGPGATQDLLALWRTLGPAFDDSWQALTAFGVLSTHTPIELVLEQSPRDRSTQWHSTACPRVHAARSTPAPGTDAPTYTSAHIAAGALSDTLAGARLDSCIESVHKHPVFTHVDPGVLHAAYWMTWSASPNPVDEHAMLSAATRLRYLLLTAPQIPASTATAEPTTRVDCRPIDSLISTRLHALRTALATLEATPGYQVALGRHLAAEMRLRVLRDPHQQCTQLADPLGDVGLVHDALAATTAYQLDPDGADQCPMTAGELNRRAVMQHLLNKGAPSVESHTLIELLPRLRERSCWILLTTPSSFALLRAAEEIHTTPGPFSIAKVPTLIMVGNEHRAPILLADGTYTSKDAQLAARTWRAENPTPLDAFVAAYHASLEDTPGRDDEQSSRLALCGHPRCPCQSQA